MSLPDILSFYSVSFGATVYALQKFTYVVNAHISFVFVAFYIMFGKVSPILITSKKYSSELIAN